MKMNTFLKLKYLKHKGICIINHVKYFCFRNVLNFRPLNEFWALLREPHFNDELICNKFKHRIN